MHGTVSPPASKLSWKHILLVVAGIVVSVLATYVFHTGQPGPQGPAGVNTVEVAKMPYAGLCWKAPTSTVHSFQVAEPEGDSNGMWCPTGWHLVNVIPKAANG